MASAEKALLASLLAHQTPQPPVARKKVDCQTELLALVQKAPLASAHWPPQSAVPLVTADESVWALEVSLQAALRAQPVLQPEEPQPATR